MKSTMMRLAAAVAAVGTLLAAVFLLAAPANASTTPPPPPHHTKGIHISNHHPKPGGVVVVSGSACTPGATVTVYFDKTTALGSGTVNPGGHYSIQVRIPTNATPGDHTISVSVANGSCQGSGIMGVTVVAAHQGSGGSSGGLASTGVAVVGIGALGVVLLAGGAMMLLAGRRRTHA